MAKTLEAHDKLIREIFEGSYQFEIPDYQRPYAWTTEQAEELFSDLVSAMQDARTSGTTSQYFLGSIVLIKNDREPKSSVVDGQQRLSTLTMLAAKENTKEGKKDAHRRYQDAVLALSKAFSLASASDEARDIREEVGFFQAIRAALVKSSTGSGVTQQERELAIQQIVSRAVVSTEIVDILAAAGIKSPDISILSDEFLAEVQQMERKNLALEALRKLINDGIRSRSKANVVQTKAFSERLEDAVARYHANAITTAEVLQELIQLAKDIRAARQRGEEQGLSDEEIAFYDALAENESAVQMMGDDKLKLIAHELLVSLRENVSVDWAHRDSARARMRVLVKRILRKYGYPPDLQDAAVQTVLQQAEALSSTWSMPRSSSGGANG